MRPLPDMPVSEMLREMERGAQSTCASDLRRRIAWVRQAMGDLNCDDFEHAQALVWKLEYLLENQFVVSSA
jgi:hypothetical protein